MIFHKVQLKNGLQIIAELNPHAHSVAVGYFVRAGSRDESTPVSGVSHFLEHMAFKGNEKYSADDVNRIFDEIGANYNASTSEEITLFYGSFLPEYIETAMELLSTLIYPSLRKDDFDMEKKVILEEIGMYDDLHSFTAYEKSMQTHFADHPLGRSILGTVQSITDLTDDQMRQYHADHYLAGNLTLAIAGNADWDQILELANKFCADWPAGRTDRPIDEATPEKNAKVIIEKGIQQQHIMQLAPAPAAQDPLRLPAELLSVILGDDSNSRLYWKLVDTGLADSAELGFNEYDGSGTWLTYLCSDPELTESNLQIFQEIYDDVNANGVTQEELDRAKNKIASRLVLRSERPMGRLSSLGGNWVYRQEYFSVEDDLKLLESVTLESIQELLQKYPLGHSTTAAVGPMASVGD
ncbi:pitrilysin family protein [uncultured Gimesia sp.]|uniref:M16 family metallopeptidase n=1 Tax=uncultured Gimesia sp. TaxID=1678688 RepID=UPI0026208849|nr:pitrilysin family protein [uncultured Gimesia sp.]